MLKKQRVVSHFSINNEPEYMEHSQKQSNTVLFKHDKSYDFSRQARKTITLIASIISRNGCLRCYHVRNCNEKVVG